MKNLFLFSILLLLFGAVAQAQIIELDEAKVEYMPKLAERADGSFTYDVREEFTGEFVTDAVGFLKKNFDISRFINRLGDPTIDSYLVTLVNSKGYLEAEYDGDGVLKKTRQQFNDILVPANVRHQLYKDHKGWTMVSNRYRARGNGDYLSKESYRIKLLNGNKSQIVKIDPQSLRSTVVAGL